MLEDLKAYGADESALPQRLKARQDYAIWAEHEDVVVLFLRCQTQWRTTMAGVSGLDYGAVFAMMDLYDVGNRQQVMADLQIMEAHAKQLINDGVAKQMKRGKK